MNIIASLAAGMVGAANGTAEIYVRGTATRAVTYPDFEASASNSSGADIPLDAYGSAEVYVNQLVDVIVKSSDGTVIRDYTDGYASGNVEVISPAFTGVDYITGMSGVSKPTTLQAVLDRWVTNSGATDWKVLINGASSTLLNAFGPVSGLVFNVKSPAYGATGDGITNDQTAIQAALADAVAAGGGTVFFPKGTYLISTAIEWAPLVNILGQGPDVSVIKTSSAFNAQILTFTSNAHTSPLLIAGVGFSASVSNSGEQIYATGVAVQLDLFRVHLGASANCVGTLIRADAGGRIRASHCRFTAGGSAYCVYLAAESIFTGCVFDTSNTSYNVAFCRLDVSGNYRQHVFSACIFDAQAVTAVPSALYGIETVSVAAYLNCVGCLFQGLTQPMTAGLKLLGGPTSIVKTSTNNFYGVTKRYEVSAVLDAQSKLELQSITRSSGSGAAYTIDDGVDTYVLRSTGTAPTFTEPTKLFAGQSLKLVIRNSSGGNWAAMSFPSSAVIVGSTAVNDTQTAYVEMMVVDPLTAGTYGWYVLDIRVG